MTKKKTLSVEFIETILSLYPDYDSIRGPYLKSNGNTYVVLNNSKLKKTDKNKLKPILYAKAIVEFNLKKKIDNGLIFNFKDNNPENIIFENIEVITRGEHFKRNKEDKNLIKKEIIKEEKEIKHKTRTLFPCSQCGNEFTLSSKQETKIKNGEKNYFFCSRECIGEFQKGRSIKKQVDIVSNDEFNYKLLKLYSDFDSVNGPYKRKDGRKHIVLNNSNLEKNAAGKLKTISYPKALMEVHLGRLLLEDETVDHIDKDVNNNDFNNLQILKRNHHSSLDCKRRKEIKLPCGYCGKEFILTKDQVANLQRKGDKQKSNVFCSKTCSGKYGAEIRNGTREKEYIEITPEYYTNKEKE